MRQNIADLWIQINYLRLKHLGRNLVDVRVCLAAYLSGWESDRSEKYKQYKVNFFISPSINIIRITNNSLCTVETIEYFHLLSFYSLDIIWITNNSLYNVQWIIFSQAIYFLLLYCNNIMFSMRGILIKH